MAGRKKSASVSYKVAQEFRDIADFSKVHAVGDDVSDMEESRLKELVEGGLVTKEGGEGAADDLKYAGAAGEDETAEEEAAK